jgi:hypothetical protein
MRRGFLGLPLALWALIATAATALAVVGFIVFLPFQGSLTTVDGIDVSFVENSDLDGVTNGDGTCHAVVTADGITFQILNMDYGENCSFTVQVTNAGADANLRSLQPDMPGYNAYLGSYCGTSIPGDDSLVTIGFEFTDFEPGVSYGFDSGFNEGLEFVRSDIYNADPGICA